MKTVKKIVIIGTTDTNMFGFRGDFIQACVAKGYEVFTFVSEFSEKMIQKLMSIGAQVITYKLSRGGLNPFLDIASYYELKDKIRKINPDVVFSYSTKPVIYGTMAAHHLGVKSIIGMIEGLGSPFTVHKSGETYKQKITRLIQVNLYRIIFPLLDKIIFLNSDDPVDLVENYKIKCKRNSIEVLGAIGLNLNYYKYSRWEDNTPISFIFVARLLAEKGIFDFIEAAKIVKNKYNNIQFKVIGGIDNENPSGLSREQLDKLISQGLIEYDGFVTDVPERLKKSSVFVLPSYYREGVPRSIQEAMAVGRPIITTDVPGCRETVINGHNGFLVEKWNPIQLAEKMFYFIKHPKEINNMGINSFNIAQKNFDANLVNLKLMKILNL